MALLTALDMKNGPKKRKLEEYVTTVIDERHRALYKAFELINKCIGNTPYSGVYNIRLVGTTRKDTPPTTEFDFVMEDRNKAIYINVEKTDKGNRQLKQIKRNTELINGNGFFIISGLKKPGHPRKDVIAERLWM